MVIFQIIVAILLIGVILLQQQGSGLGTSWGGSGASYHTRQGLEKLLFRFTIILVIVFVGLAVWALL
ncbi:MAG: Preprotein translocase, SecG subunit [Parcubacteria group bacterium GW2011_GWC2_45_7]|nr:MAG: Preprotein translocase, SecG subunit [Parcubacteria group bacterium GW2011_GWC2_45_7]